MKKSIRLTENDLHRIVRRSVNRIMNEEWESPLDKVKKNRNDFDNVKKIDVSKFQKKPKKSKKGTLEDLPSFEKLKGLKFENRINRIVKESMNRVLRESFSNPYDEPDYPTECPYCESDNIECIGGRGISERWVCNDCGEEFEPYDFPEPPQGDGANGACRW